MAKVIAGLIQMTPKGDTAASPQRIREQQIEVR